MKRFIIPLFAALLITNGTMAQAGEHNLRTDVDALVNNYMYARNIPGVAVAIYDKGKSHIFTYGYANQAKKIPVTANTIFDMASISKVFTTTMLATQIQNGKIKLADPIVKFLPSLANTKDLPIDDVTVLQLATHTSSFPRDIWNFGVPKKDAPKIMEALKTWEPDYPIGTKYRYSNVGFGLLGEVTANAAKQGYINLLNKEIVKPLHLTRTMIFIPKAQIKDQAVGYRLNEVSPPFVTTFLYGGGSLRSSAADMLKFVKANLGVKNSAPQALLDAMQLTQQPHYKVNKRMTMGLGWQLVNRNGEKFITKNGKNIGFNTFVLFSPSRQIGIVVLTNQRDGNATMLGRMIFADMIGMKQATPAEKQPVVKGPTSEE